ncbi:hypothetical protein [Gordonibacter urolithinfaciens]|uniref:hypothetical protein n=1 Tax=Gordonibacter urolithinfaciens TaxID=1335613 RepID=UPI001D05D8BC|nr:hypothetical protein [Gordonibacter urolithinfaciens]MCB6560943.1 hypothetical protein [Gordonibacter urolithinfaciens]
MSQDPFNDYAAKMQEVRTSDRLRDEVLKKAAAERRAAGATGKVPAGSGAACNEARPCAGPGASSHSGSARKPSARPRAKRPAIRRLALAACLAALAAVVGISLAWPQGSGSLPAGISPTAFAVKAYGAVDDTLFPTGSNGTIVFNCETETQRMIPPEGDEYANEGFYTGCVFSVEGDNIARVQANVSRGELYRVTSKVWSRENDPEFVKEVNSWKPYKIGQGELLGKYDYVAGVLYYGTIEPGDENVGKDRNDPSRTGKSNLYQRLGSTVDTSAMDAPEASASEYRFGLWTNEPFDAVENDRGELDGLASMNAALDTLDGAQLTITVTFTDGRTATQVVDLHAADFKANIIETADGVNHVLELVPQITTEAKKTTDEFWEAYNQGIASIHTLYGTVASETDEPFPCGEASYPFLTEPLTQPRELELPPETSPDGDASNSKSNVPPGPTIEKGSVADLASMQPYHEADTTTTFERVERLDGLPEGVAVEDLILYYEGSGGRRDEETGSIDVRGKFSIAADGTLSPGFSYVLITKTVTNNSSEQADVFLTQGFFVTLQPDGGNRYTSGRDMLSEAIWRSGHDGPAWESHYYFQMMEPGETREVSVLYVISDEMLANPGFSFVYYGHEDMPGVLAFRIGALG